MAARIVDVLADAPPLSEAQCAELARLLGRRTPTAS